MTLESLAMSGTFDCFPEYHRRQYIAGKEGDLSLTEKLILFGGSAGTATPPKIDPIEPFSEIEKLHFEK